MTDIQTAVVFIFAAFLCCVMKIGADIRDQLKRIADFITSEDTDD